MKRYATIIIFALLLALATLFIAQKLSQPELSKELIAGTEHIDGDIVMLNTKYSARIEKMYFKDGEAIKKGGLIALLDSKEIEAQAASLDATIESMQKQKSALEASLSAKESEIALLEQNIQSVVTIKNEELKIAANNADLAKLRVAQNRLVLDQKTKDFERAQKLYGSKAISQESFESAQLAYGSTNKEQEILSLQLISAQNALRIAKEAAAMAQSRSHELDVSKQALAALQNSLQAHEKQILSLQAQRTQITAMLDELRITSPIDGFVIQKVANAGEVIGAGGLIATLSDTSTLYLKIFVDTIENGRIKVGDSAVIFSDAYPNKPIAARVSAVSAKAEFTPKEVSVRSDRIQRVYSVHLTPLEYDATLKLGLPAIGVIAIEGAKLPASLSEIPQI